VRADITPQVARIDAHMLNRKGCDAPVLLRQRAARTAGGTRGNAANRSRSAPRSTVMPASRGDLEIQGLLCQALATAGVKGARMDVGHVAVFRSLVRAGEVGHELEVELFEALQRKDVPALKTLTKRTDAKTRAALLLLPDCMVTRLFCKLRKENCRNFPNFKKHLPPLGPSRRRARLR